MMKKSPYLVMLLTLSFLLLVWMGCSSGKKTVKQESPSQEQQSQEDYDEIEKLLGISRDTSEAKKADAQSTASGEKSDDLIKLLEVDEGKKKQDTSGVSSPVEDKRLARLQEQNEKLRKEIQDKNMEIANLKAKVMLLQESAGGAQAKSESRKSYRGKTGSSASDDYVRSYDEGLALFHQYRYKEALSVFEDLLARDTNNKYSDNAQYWIGECYYAMGRYREAIMAFEKVFTFRYSNKNDYAQFKIGQSYFKLGEKQRAQQEFQQLLDNYPESELISRAREYLAQL